MQRISPEQAQRVLGVQFDRSGFPIRKNIGGNIAQQTSYGTRYYNPYGYVETPRVVPQVRISPVQQALNNLRQPVQPDRYNSQLRAPQPFEGVKRGVGNFLTQGFIQPAKTTYSGVLKGSANIADKLDFFSGKIADTLGIPQTKNSVFKILRDNWNEYGDKLEKGGLPEGLTKKIYQGIGQAAPQLAELGTASKYLGAATLPVLGAVEGYKEGGLKGAAMGALGGGLTHGIFKGISPMKPLTRAATAGLTFGATAPGDLQEKVATGLTMGGFALPGGPGRPVKELLGDFKAQTWQDARKAAYGAGRFVGGIEDVLGRKPEEYVGEVVSEPKRLTETQKQIAFNPGQKNAIVKSTGIEANSPQEIANTLAAKVIVGTMPKEQAIEVAKKADAVAKNPLQSKVDEVAKKVVEGEMTQGEGLRELSSTKKAIEGGKEGITPPQTPPPSAAVTPETAQKPTISEKPLQGIKAGGRIHQISPQEKAQAQKVNPQGVEFVTLNRDITVKNLSGETKTYKKGEDVAIYQDPQTGKAVVKDGDYGVLPKNSVTLVKQASNKPIHFISTEPITFDMLKERLKEAKGDIKKSLTHLEEMGRRAWSEGKQKFAPWQLRMKAILGDMWDGFKQHMSNIFGRVKKWYAESRLSSERGAVNIGAAAKKAQEVKDAALEKFADTQIRVKRLMDRKDVKVSEATNRYDKEIVYHGKIKAQHEKVEKIAENIAKDVVDTAKKLKKETKEMRGVINEYLVAKHAPERNAALGEKAAKMTTEEAGTTAQRIESSPEFNDIKRISDKVKDLNKMTLKVLQDAEVIDAEFVRTLNERYKNHVPLQRVFEESENINDVLMNRGLDVKGTGIKRAVGSERDIADVLANTVANVKQAIVRAEKNILDKSIWDFYQENKDLGVVSEYKPKVMGSGPGGPIFEQVNDPQILALRVGGKQKYLYIADENLAIALKGVGKEQVGEILKTVGMFSRWIAQLATRYNPSFAPVNILRDFPEAMIYMASQKDVGIKGALGMSKQFPSAFSDVTKAMLGKPSPIYEEMIAEGGTTGGITQTTKKQIDKSIEKIFAEAEQSNADPRKILRALGESTDKWNTIFEDATRLTVYKQARAMGLSKQRSAILAKEASINFNRFGKLGPAMNSLFVFFNPGVQGAVKMTRSLVNKKVAATVFAASLMAQIITQMMNYAQDDEWEKKVSKWDQQSGLPIYLGENDGKARWISLPISWGVKPVNAMTKAIAKVILGKDVKPARVGMDVLEAVVDGYNPIGGTDLPQAVTPTVLDPWMDVWRNKKWSGSPIRPEYDKYMPKSEKYYGSLERKGEGKMFIQIADGLAKKGIEVSPADMEYVYSTMIGGAGRFVSQVANVPKTVKEGRLQDVPFASRFYRSQDIRESGYEREDAVNTLTEQSRASAKIGHEADRLLKLDTNTLINELKTRKVSMPKEEYKALESSLKRKMDQESKQPYGQIAKMQVNNGVRAKFLAEQIDKMPMDKYIKFLKDLKDRGLLTKDVEDQMSKLIK